MKFSRLADVRFSIRTKEVTLTCCRHHQKKHLIHLPSQLFFIFYVLDTYLKFSGLYPSLRSLSIGKVHQS